MNADDVRRLFDFSDWANERMLAAIGELSDEQFTRNISSSFPSIRETLAHITFADWLWQRRFLGQSPTTMPDWAASTSLADLRERLFAVADERRAFLAKLSDDEVAAPLSYRSMDGDPFTHALADALFHLANHSTYHRGQLVTMLRQVGAKPPGTDFLPFVRRQSRSE